MKRLALLLLLLSSAAFAGTMNLLGAGTGAPTSGGGSGYTGPIDVVASPLSWWGLRAASSATRGNALINVCNSTGGVDVGCGDLSSDATTGALTAATISGITCPGANCTVKVFYDQSGNGYNLTSATVAKRLTLDSSCVNSLPCASSATVTNPCYVAGSTNSMSSPFTSVVTAITPTTGNRQTLFSVSSDLMEANFGVAANGGEFAGTGLATYTGLTDGSWHSIIGLWATGGTSHAYINGTVSATDPLNPGTVGWTSAYFTLGGYGGAGPTCVAQPMTAAKFVETGFWSGTFSAGNITSMDSNIRTYWGPF